MKTYLRILSYAGPLKRFLALYLLAIILGTLFGVINLSMLIPVLKVLFEQNTPEESLVTISQPTFSWSITYLRGLFNYHLTNIMTSHGLMNALYLVCLIVVLSMLLSTLFRYLAEAIAAGLRVRVVHNLRQALFDKVSRLHMGYFHEQHRGEIIAKLMGDVQEVDYAMTYLFRVFLKDPVTIVGYFTLLFYMAPALIWLVLLLLFIVGGSVGWLLNRVLRHATQSQAALGRLMTVIEEAMEGTAITQKAVRSYIATRFSEKDKHYRHLNFMMLLENSLVPLLSELLGALMILLLLIYGGKMVLLHESSFTVSSFITYLIVFAQLLVPIKAISKYLGSIQRGLAAGQRIFALADTPPAIVNIPNARTIQALQQGIVFEGVGFSYGSRPLIQHLDLTLEAGKKTALVGLSGSGKSTLIRLLSRQYDVTEGVIKVDGYPIQAYRLEDLHELIGLATSESVFFHDSVWNNITLRRPGISKKDVLEAARLVQAHDFIQQFPQSYQTIIGPGGQELSNGQKQQLGLARAVLANPVILIMDEAISALDGATAQQVQANIDRFMQHGTLLVVAHRLAIVQNADKILVMESGEIIEQGTHKTLMQQSGLYKSLNLYQG